MATIITVADLPASIQTAELVDMMVAGANAKASRVAPCLPDPTSAAWAASTAYAVGDQVTLAAGEFLEVTVAGTSGTVAPTVPAKVDGTVSDGTVTWKRIAPTPDQLSEARLVLVGAVQRWVEAGAGALQQQTAGPFGMSIDTRQKSSGFNLWPSEIKQLQDICNAGRDASAGAFSITPSAGTNANHAPWCAINFGANYCSCGADIAGYPLYESADTDAY